MPQLSVNINIYIIPYSYQRFNEQSYFPLSEQFITQSEPAYCALSSMAMVLNALNHDPGRIWKGNWRWVSEETLQCVDDHDRHESHHHHHASSGCSDEHERQAQTLIQTKTQAFFNSQGKREYGRVSSPHPQPPYGRSIDASSGPSTSTPPSCGHDLTRIRDLGMNFGEFQKLAECHGLNMLTYRANSIMDSENKKLLGELGEQQHREQCGAHDQTSEACPSHAHAHTRQDMSAAELKFRSYVRESCHSSSSDMFIIANFSRGFLKQTGDGHFSPVGGYHEEKDMVLILDVARFKYPPFWVPLRQLWGAMEEKDAEVGEARGYFILKK